LKKEEVTTKKWEKKNRDVKYKGERRPKVATPKTKIDKEKLDDKRVDWEELCREKGRRVEEGTGEGGVRFLRQAVQVQTSQAFGR